MHISRDLIPNQNCKGEDGELTKPNTIRNQRKKAKRDEANFQTTKEEKPALDFFINYAFWCIVWNWRNILFKSDEFYRAVNFLDRLFMFGNSQCLDSID